MSSKRFGKKKKDKEKAANGAGKPKPATPTFGSQKASIKGAGGHHTHFQRRTSG
jgi:hypothetical protein